MASKKAPLVEEVKKSKEKTYNEAVKDNLEKITIWKRQGYTIEMMAQKLGISRQTFYKYLKKYAGLREALARGKKEYEVDLRNSLYARAKGFMITEKTTRKYYNADGDLVKTEEMEKERYIFSDFLATRLLRLETVLDSDDMPLELQEIMRITEEDIEGEYADE